MLAKLEKFIVLVGIEPTTVAYPLPIKGYKSEILTARPQDYFPCDW